jgi:excisionase family DNA binding protein
MENGKRVLTPEQVANELGISRNLVYRQIKSGIIPSVKVGTRYLISIIAFEKWLSSSQGNTITKTF